MEIKDKVVEVRGRLLISQQQLAQELGVSYATVNRWEKGHNIPSFIAQRKFDNYCNSKGIKFDIVAESDFVKL